MSSPSLSPGCEQGAASCPWHFTCSIVAGKKRAGQEQVPPGWSQASTADDNVQGTSWGSGHSHPPLGASGWQRVHLAADWRGVFICGLRRKGQEGHSAYGRSLCWASVCPHACLSVALKEAGAGPAAAWAELLLRGTQLLSRVRLTASLLIHLDSPHGAWSQPLLSGKTVDASFSGGTAALWEVSRERAAGDSP